MKDKFVTAMQTFSKAIVVPVLYLPAIGLILVICNFITNPAIVGVLPFLGAQPIQVLFKVLYSGLMSVFNNLGPIFAIGVAFGLAKKKKEHAALISFLCLFIFCSAQNAYLTQMNLLDEAVGNGQNLMLGFQIVDMGVFLGIVIGVVVGLLYNKYCDKDLGEVLSVYGGTKFVFLISIPIMLALAILFVYIWPPVQNLITSVATFISTSGGVGYFTFGFLERLLIPTGLHHLLGSAVWYTDLGGVATVAGKEYVGSWAIALAQLSDPGTAKLSLVTIFNNVTLCKLFGLTGAGLAMLSCAKPSMKNKAKAIYIPAILSSCLAAITEPIEFTFLFVAPMLFVVHAFLAATLATTMWLAGIVGINSGGLIEIASLNLIPLMRNHWQQYLLELVIGLIFTAIWFVVFRFLILKFDFKTPGREDEAEIEFGSKEKFRNKQAEKGGKAGDPKLELCELILEGLGGKDNIVDVTNCATRLRVNVKDETLCKDDPYFKAIGTHGCSINGKAYQVIIGLKVPSIREVFETLL